MKCVYKSLYHTCRTFTRLPQVWWRFLRPEKDAAGHKVAGKEVVIKLFSLTGPSPIAHLYSISQLNQLARHELAANQYINQHRERGQARQRLPTNRRVLWRFSGSRWNRCSPDGAARYRIRAYIDTGRLVHGSRVPYRVKVVRDETALEQGQANSGRPPSSLGIQKKLEQKCMLPLGRSTSQTTIATCSASAVWRTSALDFVPSTFLLRSPCSFILQLRMITGSILFQGGSPPPRTLRMFPR